MLFFSWVGVFRQLPRTAQVASQLRLRTHAPPLCPRGHLGFRVMVWQIVKKTFWKKQRGANFPRPLCYGALDLTFLWQEALLREVKLAFFANCPSGLTASCNSPPWGPARLHALSGFPRAQDGQRTICYKRLDIAQKYCLSSGNLEVGET